MRASISDAFTSCTLRARAQTAVAQGEMITMLDTEAERAGGWAYVQNARGQEGASAPCTCAFRFHFSCALIHTCASCTNYCSMPTGYVPTNYLQVNVAPPPAPARPPVCRYALHYQGTRCFIQSSLMFRLLHPPLFPSALHSRRRRPPRMLLFHRRTRQRRPATLVPAPW